MFKVAQTEEGKCSKVKKKKKSQVYEQYSIQIVGIILRQLIILPSSNPRSVAS